MERTLTDNRQGILDGSEKTEMFSVRNFLKTIILICLLSTSISSFALDDTATLTLSLQDAMTRASQNNVQVLIALEKIKAAKGQSLQAASALLPQVSGYLLQERLTRNYAASGLAEEIIGPYNHFEARAQLVQNIFDLSAIDSVRAAHVNVKKVKLQETLAQQQAAWQAALAYFNLLQAQASFYGFQSDVKLAEELAQIARDQHGVGIARAIDQIRAETRLSYAQTYVLQAKTLVTQADLSLKKIIGLPFDTPIRLTDTLARKFADAPALDSAITQAKDQRVELKVAREELLGKKLEHQAAWKRQLPSLSVSGNYGDSGSEPAENIEDTFQATAQLSIPLFDGGKTIGRAMETSSQEHQARILLNDLQTQVEMDVRIASETFTQMRSQLGTTWKAYDLAQKEMTQARDQYVAGVGDSLSLVTAETNLTQARESYVAAQAQYRAAWVNWEYAVGNL